MSGPGGAESVQNLPERDGPCNGTEERENLGQHEKMSQSGRSLARLFMVCKKILDYSVIIPGFLTNYLAAIPICSSILALGVAALTVDFFSVRVRRSNGLPAVWPKLIPVVFVLVYTVCLLLLCAGLFSNDDFREWNGVIASSSFALMSILSVLVGRPFVYADVIELVSVEQLRQWEASPSFVPIMNAVTGLWACTFVAYLVVHLIAMKFYLEGNKQASTLIGSIAPWVIVLVMQMCIQPRVVARVRKQYSTDDVPPSEP